MSQTESRIRLIFEGAEQGVGAAAAKARAALHGLDDDNKRLGKSTNELKSAFGGLVSNFAGRTGTFTLGLAAAGIGAVGAAAGAAIPLLGGLGAAFAATKLGADGFKKAAEQLKAPVDNLKKSLSDTFAKELTPSFAKLGPVISSLTGPLTGMAKAEATVVKGLVDVVVNAQKMGQLDAIIQGGTDLVAGMGKGVADLAAGFLSASAEGSKAMRGLGTAVGSVLSKIGATLQGLAAGGQISKAMDVVSSALRGLGDVAAPLIDILVRMGAALGDSVGNALSQFGEGLKRAGPGLIALAGAGGRLLDTLAPLLPTIGEVAGALATSFAGSIDALLPTIKGLVGFLNEHKEQLVALAPLISSAVTAYAGFKVVSAIGGWVSAATGALGLLGGAAEGAGGKVGGLATKLRGLSGLQIAAGLGAAAIAMDAVNASSEQGNLSGWNGELHDMQRILTGDWGNPLADISAQLDQMSAKWSAGQAPVQQWALAVGQAATTAATSVQNFFRGLVGLPPLPPVKLDVDPTTGQAKVSEFVGGISRTRGTAQLDADASRGNNVLGGWKGSANATVGTAALNANAGGANAALGGWRGSANATVGTARLNANPGQANSARAGWQASANGTVGTARLNANAGGANAALGGWRGSANATVGTARLNANTSAATGAINAWRSWASGIVVTVRAVLSKIGFAAGGPVLPGMAHGGSVSGPGTGTSDTAGLFPLSAGEWVMTAREVDNAGGFAGMARLAAALDRGRPIGLAGGGSPMRASAQAAMRTVSTSSSSAGGGRVQLVVAPGGDGALATVIMRMVRTGQIQLKAA